MKQGLFASLLVLFSLCGMANPIEQLVDEYVDSAHVGLFIQDAHSKEILYAHHAQKGFTPASVTKSFTTAAALLILDHHFSYQTTLRYDKSQLDGNTLNGDLVFTFMGDPTFTSNDLEQLLASLSAHHINTITGNIIIDNTYFPQPVDARGVVAEDLHWYFGTPAKTVIIDENQIPIGITPDELLGQKVEIHLLRDDIHIPITHEVITASKQAANTLCQLNVELNPINNGVHLYGCWPINDEQKQTTLKVALANPELRAQQIIYEYLAQQNIRLQGKINSGAAFGPDVLSAYQSPPLHELNAVIMKQSNNLYADSLAKILGKKQYQLGTLQAGSEAIKQTLINKLKLDIHNIRLFDGSGNSTYNQVTPLSVAMLLQAMYDNPQYQRDYLTMQQVDNAHPFYNRLPENVSGSFYIKTGSMTGVNNITGYIKTKSGKTLIVVCLLNQLPSDKTKARAFEQQLLTYLMKI